MESLVMHCPNCGSNDTRIKDSRQRTKYKRFRRIFCHTCKHKFNTVEIPQKHYDEASEFRVLAIKIGKLITENIYGKTT